ncbi:MULTISPECIES: head completion/stabilization protein [unclassified Sphingobium]|uniref:head completion/stabilization protein n=1 Tax=unclassified Sphingobium TaxID=2611147 RepID=UPI002224F0D3|nr:MULTISPECIES: head completion/stabilization protein [unclassified Sphingobium]MCW2410884.1 hypothetical protein [Sphingobium sp. B8D3D]MCW2416826.1 hypothetical protein [Sphingobium sp. B8D3A]
MSFVAKPPAPESGPPPAETVIENDGFFPAIDPREIRELARITSSITAPRLRGAILAAMDATEIDLRAWVAEQTGKGHATLADVPAPQLGGESRNLIRYRRIIALLAKAELIDRHRDFDTTAAGASQGDELDESVRELRRDAAHAIRDMLGRTRTTVDLI